MEYWILGSGSTGNAIILRGRRSLLLDCGFSPKTIHRRLEDLGSRAEDLAGIVVTHEHADHARGAAALAEELHIPVVGTPGTLASAGAGEFQRRAVAYGETVEIEDFDITLYPVAHDAAEPAGVRVSYEGRSLALLTDAGHITPQVVEALRGADHLLVESNHDPDLLKNGPYPARLKQRIAGGWGHLSNDACGALLRQVVTAQTRRVVLHHLSRFNNTPELALATNHAILRRGNLAPQELVAAPPHGPFGPWSW